MLKTDPVGFKICSISESERAKFHAILDSPAQAAVVVSFPDRLAALMHWPACGGSSSSTDADCSILFPSDDLSTTTSPVRSTDDPSPMQSRSSPSYSNNSSSTTTSPMREPFQVGESAERSVVTVLTGEILTTAHDLISSVTVFETPPAAAAIYSSSSSSSSVYSLMEAVPLHGSSESLSEDVVIDDEVEDERLSSDAEAEQQLMQEESVGTSEQLPSMLFHKKESILDAMGPGEVEGSEQLLWMVCGMEQAAVSVDFHPTDHQDQLPGGSTATSAVSPLRRRRQQLPPAGHGWMTMMGRYCITLLAIIAAAIVVMNVRDRNVESYTALPISGDRDDVFLIGGSHDISAATAAVLSFGSTISVDMSIISVDTNSSHGVQFQRPPMKKMTNIRERIVLDPTTSDMMEADVDPTASDMIEAADVDPTASDMIEADVDPTASDMIKAADVDPTASDMIEAVDVDPTASDMIEADVPLHPI